ncbi:MAG: Fic family protein [Minwuia sp.]|nr:Fic family protein [Minwuia sp.]
MDVERFSEAQQQEIITDPEQKARREAENGLRQFGMAMDFVRDYVHDNERAFKLRSSLVIRLNHACLEGIHPLAGTYRNTPVKIHGSRHEPPESFLVGDLVHDMCEYVNTNWEEGSALHLAAYLLWRLNWIHPFADGNGRTSRMVSYVVLCIKLDSMLPGRITIPDQIADNKDPYYDGLEQADKGLAETGTPDLSVLEDYLSGLLAHQLVEATRLAGGQVDTDNGFEEA